MASIEIDSRERQKADELLKFVKAFFLDLSVEGRMVFAVEMARLMQPEIDELNRRAKVNS